MIRLSFLLSGDKMRQRLAQMLEQAQVTESNQDKEHEVRREANLPRAGAIE